VSEQAADAHKMGRPRTGFLRAELAGGQQNSSSASATMMPPGPRM
jgi:hypothetical protein